MLAGIRPLGGAELALTAWALRRGNQAARDRYGRLLELARSAGAKRGDGRRRWERVPGPLDDLKFANGHTVVIMLDTNCRIEINAKVYWSRAELTVEMNKPQRGCTVLLADLSVEGEINGLDNYIAMHGDAAMTEVIAQAHYPAYKSAHEQAAAETAMKALLPNDLHGPVRRLAKGCGVKALGTRSRCPGSGIAHTN